MDILAAAMTAVILGLLYWRMIRRETPERIGVALALAGYAGLLIYELVVLIRFRKKTALFCGMSTLAEAAA